MSRTTTPCPGCGQVDHRRPANKICDGCKQLLDNAKAVLEAADAERRKGYALYQHDGHPGFYGGRWDIPRTERGEQTLRAAMEELVDVVANQETVPEVGSWGHHLGESHAPLSSPDADPLLWVWPDGRRKGHDNYGRHVARLHPEQAIALNRLDDAIREALSAVYRQGKRHGSDLIAQLAKGELSLKDLAKVALEDSDDDTD